ncbi:hypothetical protein ACLI4Q_05710 [Natrialbaceae archaeon A-CW1-1]
MTRDDRSSPDPHEALEHGREDREGRRVGVVGPRLPTALAWRFLSCSLEAPETVTVGEPAPFFFRVKNRAPTSLTLECATSRTWGWIVDDVPEAGVGCFEPPAKPATVAFGPRERRTFVGRWDGQFRETDGERERWVPATGTHTLTAYLALEDWRGRGLTESVDLTVRG